MTAESAILAIERSLHLAEVGPDELPPPTASATARALTEALSSGAIADHVAAVRDGAMLTQEGAIVTLTVSDGEVLMELDEESQIGRLAFAMNAADLPRRGLWSRLFGRP